MKLSIAFETFEYFGNGFFLSNKAINLLLMIAQINVSVLVLARHPLLGITLEGFATCSAPRGRPCSRPRHPP